MSDFPEGFIESLHRQKRLDEDGEAQNAAVQTAQELLACNLTIDNQAAEIGRLKAELEAALKDRVAPAVLVEPASTKPLTVAQIEHITPDEDDREAVTAVVRDTEAAHGIKEPS